MDVESRETMLFNQILLPVDFSPCSDEAFRMGCRLTRMTGAVVIALHVIDTSILAVLPQIGLSVIPSSVQAQRRRLRHHARSSLRRLLECDEAKGVNCTRLILEGVPYAEIVKVTRTKAIDLIVMGTYGVRAGNIDKLFFGSTAEKVMRIAGCSVLTVPLAGPVTTMPREKGERK
jgi:nucleotide-binding universal stress UspA family protein